MKYITIYVEVSEEYDVQSVADVICNQLHDVEGIKDFYDLYVENNLEEN